MYQITLGGELTFELTWVNPIWNGFTWTSERLHMFKENPRAGKAWPLAPALELFFLPPWSWLNYFLPTPTHLTTHPLPQIHQSLASLPSLNQFVYLQLSMPLPAAANAFICCSQFGFRQLALSCVNLNLGPTKTCLHPQILELFFVNDYILFGTLFGNKWL